MRKFWLILTNARLRAVLGALRATGPGIGDLVRNPGAAPAFFRPLRAGLRCAASAGPSASEAPPRALAAAEDFLIRLEKFFSDLDLHKTVLDAAAMEALLALQRACDEAPGLLSPGGREAAASVIRGLSARAHKTLTQAGAAAGSSPDGFPEKLKFSSIYSGLDAIFNAYEGCAEALSKA